MTSRVDVPALSLLWGVRQSARAYLLRQVDWSVRTILPWFQRRQSPWRTRYMRTASLLGSEEFYIVMIPLLQWWLWGPRELRILSLVFAAAMYTGNSLKNLFALPRPPVACLVGSTGKQDRSLDNRDFGWPSVHSLNAVAIPFMALRLAFGSVLLWEAADPQTMALAYCAAFAYTGSITYSRLYLGVHSPADVQAGMLIGGLLLRAALWTHDDVDAWLDSAPPARVALVVLAAALALLLAHPRARPATYTFEESTCLLGFIAGYLCGFAGARALGVDVAPAAAPLAGLARLPVGYGLMFAGKELLKMLSAPLRTVPASAPKKDDDDDCSGDLGLGVGEFGAGDAASRLLQYGAGFGAVVSLGAPWVFGLVGI